MNNENASCEMCGTEINVGIFANEYMIKDQKTSKIKNVCISCRKDIFSNNLRLAINNNFAECRTPEMCKIFLYETYHEMLNFELLIPCIVNIHAVLDTLDMTADINEAKQITLCFVIECSEALVKKNK